MGFCVNVSTYLCKKGAAVTFIKLLGEGKKGTAPGLTFLQLEIPDHVVSGISAQRNRRWPDGAQRCHPRKAAALSVPVHDFHALGEMPRYWCLG
jgi:hypothetical protein